MPQGLKARNLRLVRARMTRFQIAGCACRLLRRTLCCTLAGLAVLTGWGGFAGAAAATSAVVLMYQRFGDRNVPSAAIRIDQFEAHLKVIAERGLNVMALPEILAALKARRSLPDRTVALTVDGAFLSFYTEAWPRLRQAELPVTLFVSTDAIDEGREHYMSWEQIREVVRGGATIGNQTASHSQMPTLGRERNDRDIKRASRRFEEELGARPELFAYPYGAMSLTVREVVLENGFAAALGHHSGVIHPGSRFHFLPRFPMNEVHGDAERFRLAADALPLEVTDITPADSLLGPAGNPPNVGFTVAGRALAYIDLLTCYASGQGKVRLERIGPARVELRFNRAFPPGRPRLNCTMPARQGRWRWFGTQFLVPRP